MKIGLYFNEGTKKEDGLAELQAILPKDAEIQYFDGLVLVTLLTEIAGIKESIEKCLHVYSVFDVSDDDDEDTPLEAPDAEITIIKKPKE